MAVNQVDFMFARERQGSVLSALFGHGLSVLSVRTAS